jgi:hypothetical protein
MSRGDAICNGLGISLPPVVMDAHVVELGCGSGWVGQSICGPELRITGTDFSASQIALARENAARKRLGAFTRGLAVAGPCLQRKCLMWLASVKPPTPARRIALASNRGFRAAPRASAYKKREQQQPLRSDRRLGRHAYSCQHQA